mmetsp:Transcript_26612/g.27037  ORF Transcript_26612/g.27037 Transcript_26612/m.27037 type:complete len:89 (-) Transcript_26612:1058-1324(-)
MLRVNIDNRINKALPDVPPSRINFAKKAVPNNPPTLEINIAATTILRFSNNSFLRLNIETAKLTTDGPRQNRRRSPAPAAFQARLPVL